jgi:hypothetical protein
MKVLSAKNRNLRCRASLATLVLGVVPVITGISAPSMGADGARALDRPWIILAQADQPADVDRAQAQYDDALRAVLADPTDVEANYAFAEAAVAVGDIQGAIGALERILLVQPDRPDIKLRLGQLYQEVGAFELAESYLGGGLESRDIPQVIQEQAQRLFDEAAQQQILATRRHLFQGSLFLGGGWESNANAGPPSNMIRLFGFEGPFLADEDKEQSDYSGFAIADLDYFYDLGFQAGHRIEADLLLLGQRYGEVNRSNTALVDAEFGPRFFINPAIEGRPNQKPVSIRPFFLASYLNLGDDDYRTSLGGGLNFSATLARGVGLEVTGLGAYDNFDDTNKEPTASNQTGPRFQLNPQLLWFATDTTLVTLEGLAGHRNADEGFETFNEWGAVAGVTQFFQPLERWLSERLWSFSLAGAYRNTDYNKPDPLVDPDQTRNDDRWDITAQLSVPVAAALSVNLGFQQTWNESNIPNDDFRNSAWRGSLRYTF